MKLYNTLGVDQESTQAEIKKAYRKLCSLWHPDKHMGKEAKAEATEKFKEIKNAYEILGDIDRRAEYDIRGDIEDEKRINPIEAEITRLFTAFIDQDDFDGNIISIIALQVSETIEALYAKVKDLNNEILKFNIMKDRVSCLASDNLFNTALMSKITSIKNSIDHINETIDLFENVAEKLLDYIDHGAFSSSGYSSDRQTEMSFEGKQY
ncbi:J domain-containing protein [Colwellia piezophila]|uniref:J domain-containing protein n=1 Tax=Colwellia piezophila TaxID=211668 RepID=UPI00036A34CC|nr:J domain-containing protein [Colwellia piezophila]